MPRECVTLSSRGYMHVYIYLFLDPSRAVKRWCEASELRILTHPGRGVRIRSLGVSRTKPLRCVARVLGILVHGCRATTSETCPAVTDQCDSLFSGPFASPLVFQAIRSLLESSCISQAAGQQYQIVADPISTFNAGTAVVAFSDFPMTAAQEGGGIAKTYGKLTLPMFVALYTFYISGAPKGGAKLSAVQTYKMYKESTTTSWKSLGVNGIVGNVRAIAREDSSATNAAIKNYWIKAGTRFVADFPNSRADTGKFPFPGLVFKSGAAGVCAEAATKAGSVCYSQAGLCNEVTLGEVLLKNAAGKFVFATAASATAAIPRTLPPRTTAPWSVDLIWTTGAGTHPIATFVLAFIRAKGLSAAGALGTTGKNILICIIPKITASTAELSSLFPIPASISSANLAAVKAVKA